MAGRDGERESYSILFKGQGVQAEVLCLGGKRAEKFKCQIEQRYFTQFLLHKKQKTDLNGQGTPLDLFSTLNWIGGLYGIWFDIGS